MAHNGRHLVAAREKFVQNGAAYEARCADEQYIFHNSVFRFKK